MQHFQPIVDLLQQRFAGRFACQLGRSGAAQGLDVRYSDRPGRAFVFQPADNGSFLVSLYESDDDNQPEVWSARGADEVVARLQPWAFPPSRTLPLPLQRGEEQRRLHRLAEGLRARHGIPCVRVEPPAPSLQLLTSAGRKQFEHDLASVSPERIVQHFPWDPAGRLELNTTVLLAVYPTTTPPGRDRDLCLAAVGPARRRDEQRIAIQLIDLIVLNQTHRWEPFPWLWQNVNVPPSEFWGAESPLDLATRQAPQAPVPSSPSSPCAAQSMRLLDEGRLEEALALYGVFLSPDLHRLLGGERIKPPACCAHPNAQWTDLLVNTLRQSAPWLLPKAVRNESERLRRWATQKKGRPRQTPHLKLGIFPGQHHSRKASLMLVGDLDGAQPRLVIEATASNARLADSAWKRPLAVDFIRHGVPVPFPALAAPTSWPTTILQLAETLTAGEDCTFALHDALLDAGYAELAEPFAVKEHPKAGWALRLILG